jgi:hypothetical protein
MGDEDSVDQVKMEDDGVVALDGGRRVKSRRKAKASSLAEVGHTSTLVRVWWFGPQNHRWRVYGFGPQNPGGGSEEKRTARGGIRKFASR